MKPFWRTKSLADMNDEEWESLCDGCGQCCLHKLQDTATGELVVSRVSCRLLDLQTCRCTRYASRTREVPACLDLRKGFSQFHWLPATCAYRLIAQGDDLPAWHPLVSGNPHSVRAAGVSVGAFAIPEAQVVKPRSVRGLFLDTAESARELAGTRPVVLIRKLEPYL